MSYERTFSVSVPPERAFRAFTDPDELTQWFTNRFDADTESGEPGTRAEAESPGGPVGFEVTQIKQDELLAYRQWAASPEIGIDVTVVFEPVEGGTKITVTHSGFGGDSILQSDGVRTGMDETFADLVLYLERGLSFPRHRDLGAKCTLGAIFRDTTAGAEVIEVQPGELAAELGLEPGDLLLQLDAAPVFGNREIAFFLRQHDAGDEIDVVWEHGGELRKGCGVLTAFDLLTFVHHV